MDYVLKCGYYESNLDYNNEGWFVDDVIKLENKKSFYFINTSKDNILSEKDAEDYRNNNICCFCENELIVNRVRHHCHITGVYRVPAHSKCNIIAIQKQSNFIPFMFHIFSNYDCLLSFKKLVDKRN